MKNLRLVLFISLIEVSFKIASILTLALQSVVMSCMAHASSVCGPSSFFCC